MSYFEYKGLEKAPVGYWNDIENVKEFMRYVAWKEGYNEIDDWYKCSRKILEKYGVNSRIFLKNGGNLCSLLNNIYNINYFLPWKFNQVPLNFWNDINNQKWYMDWLFKELGYESDEDWYKIKNKIIGKKYGWGLMDRYNNSPYQLLKILYPKIDFLPWKFLMSPINFWNDTENQKWYMDWLFKELGYESVEDWYKITIDNIEKNYGCGLLNKYESSPQKILKNLFPSKEWLPWKFNRVIQYFWDSVENQKWYMDWLFKELGYESDEDWYIIKCQNFSKNFGGGLLFKYDGSTYKLFKTLYPKKEWLPWKFGMSPLNFWDSVENQKWYMDWLFKELGYQKMEDWYKITRLIFINNYGGGFIDKYPKYTDIFLTLYPDYPWDLSKFFNLKGETILNDFLTQNYTDIIWDYRVDWCKNPETGRHLPFDFCIPEFKNLIELDGGQHFTQISNWDNPEETRERDIYKMKMANENGYTIIRLLWEDVYNDKNNWKEKLQESIKLYETPQRIYLNDVYKEFY